MRRSHGTFEGRRIWTDAVEGGRLVYVGREPMGIFTRVNNLYRSPDDHYCNRLIPGVLHWLKRGAPGRGIGR